MIAFGVMSSLPIPRIRSYGRRGFYGRRRAFVAVDIDALLARLPAHPVIIDLGANVGAFSLKVADIAGELHAVEPDPETFAILSERLGPRPNVVLHNAAIGAVDGETSLFRGAGFDENQSLASLSSSTFVEHEAIHKGNPLRVEQIGILSLLDRIGKPVDLIKMDIEGAEVPVLETLLASEAAARVSKILVETHEHVLPHLVDRTHALREAASKLQRPLINMDWH